MKFNPYLTPEKKTQFTCNNRKQKGYALETTDPIVQEPTRHVNLFVSVTEAVLQDETLFLVIRNTGLDWNLTIISLGESFIHRSGNLCKRSAWTCMDAPGTFSIILVLLLQSSCSFLNGLAFNLEHRLFLS